MDAPFYLAVGTCIVEDGTGTTPYSVKRLEFPAPEPDGRGGWSPAVRTITLGIGGATTAAVAANAALLRRQVVRDSVLYFRPPGATETGESRIREGRLAEDEVDPLRRVQSIDSRALFTLEITTDPHWKLPWSTETAVSTVTTVPGHFDVTNVGGDDDALLWVRAVPTREGRGMAIGIKPEPGDGYSYLDDYSGTTDSNALTTAKATLSATGTYTAIGTAPSFDTNDNRGRHLMLARVDSTGTAASASTYKSRVTTTGNAISTTVTADGDHAHAATSNDLYGYELGDIQIPAGQIPSGDFGSGYAAEAVDVSNTTAASLWTTWGDASHYTVGQSFPATAGHKHTGITLKFKNNGSSDRRAYAMLHLASGDIATGASIAFGSFTIPASHDGELRISWDVAPVIPSTGQYIVMIGALNDIFTDVDLYYSSASSYANGKLNDWGTPSSTNDLYFKSHTQTPLGFNTTNPVLGACSESSKTLGLDYVQRIPVDFAAIVYRPAASGPLGLVYDGDTDTPYIGDADGIGPAAYSLTEVRRPLRIRPGVTNRVVIGILQNDEAVAGMGTLAYKTRARYLSAAW